MTTVSLTKKYFLRVTLANHLENTILGKKYHLEIKVSGKIDPLSGLIIDRDNFDNIVRQNVLSTYDQSHLNNLLEIPTGELLAFKILQTLQSTKLSNKVLQVSLTTTNGTRFIAKNNKQIPIN